VFLVHNFRKFSKKSENGLVVGTVTGVTGRIFSGLTGKNRNRKKPEPEKTGTGKNGAFQPEPPGKFPVKPGKTNRLKNSRLIREKRTASKIPG